MPFCVSAQKISLNVHLQGVCQSRISLLSLTESGTFKSILEVNGVERGETASLTVEDKYLPGEFVLRFDYKENPVSAPYPSERRLLIGNQDLELWVNPKYCNNSDSTYFQPGELENTAFMIFTEESFRQKEMIALLQDFLMNYDNTNSKFYKQGICEYEKRRQSYNQWLTGKMENDQELFAGSLYWFQLIPAISMGGSETERLKSMIDHYFDGAGLSDPAVIRTSLLTRWIDTYVNIHGQMATTVALRDSLFPEAARKAIEQARKGHPEVYGWMVDYFYRGFEVNNIPAGMKVLESYINDPACLTSKRKEIERRIQGMETLVAGSMAPEIQLKAIDGKIFSLLADDSSSPYILLLFWSADCSHCMEVIDQLYPWQQQPEINRLMSVVAISLDETETEVTAWQKSCDRYRGWTHLRAEEGVRSKIAADYFILSTPQMILLDTDTRKIIDLPGTFPELKNLVHL
ncbi:MAG: thioredoxin-like domain-containing protein [Bacteroidales bacterium]